MTENEIILFKHEEFGEIRTMNIDGEPWFVGKDIAVALGYSAPRNAIQAHVDDEDKTTALIQCTGSEYKSNAVIINESGLYSLTLLSSKLPSAKKFKRWVTAEVLPSLRKHGAYFTAETLHKTMSDPRELKPLYKYSLETAKRDGEIDAWRESRNENIRCRDFLDEQVRKKFDGFRLPDECAENAIKEFGYDRTMWVIANTILERHGDGRFHRENNDWAKKLAIPPSGRNHEFALHSHSCIVDGLASDVRKMYAALGLFSKEHTIQTDEPQDYTGKLLIIRPDVLKEESRTPENQLFLASGGFGCSPDKAGRKVMGQFLSDGERTHFYRQDFIGVIADEHIPDWAREKLSELTAEREQTQDDTPKMGM